VFRIDLRPWSVADADVVNSDPEQRRCDYRPPGDHPRHESHWPITVSRVDL